ncbi:metallophosphoesterase [Martelella radicis]|uniref:3',5'-cyclic AMP phosphodiesterase CpdA n=1 Tax=Martelella radicis TaxID=1397476 RepID=A0A7W6PC03_9HYPH|nr:metallophosphoesterase [Martelella radicis]MBB4124465.1 3',5'-cyclic AMP phosphodiesterase CpdA [Martelella radicis]
MAKNGFILHVADPHLFEKEPARGFHDLKASVEGVTQDTKEETFKLTLELLDKRLAKEGIKLDAVVFTGDAQDRFSSGGHTWLRDTLLEVFKDRGITKKNIVATPGNHDVDRNLLAGNPARFKEFIEVWRNGESVTPWLDVTDNAESSLAHRFENEGKTFEIYPINSSQWSQTKLKAPASIFSMLPELTKSLTGVEPDLVKKAYDEVILPKVEELLSADIARISPDQLFYLSNLMQHSGRDERRLRIVALHHHLTAPNVSEEFRAFNDITDLSLLREFLRENEVDVVIHGHKHVENLTYDYVYPSDGGSLDRPPHRMMVISGGALEVAKGASPLRLIKLSGLPGAPEVEVETIPLATRGLSLKRGPSLKGRVWRENHAVAGGPVIIKGTDINEVYIRAVRAAQEEARGGMLIVHLDLPNTTTEDRENLPFPRSYPDPDSEPSGSAEHAWVRDLVSWWQLPRSTLEERIPYIHGTRLERFAGRFNQIKRLTSLLRQNKTTSRGIATLVDPTRDFTADGSKEDFASFCLIQFKWHVDKVGGRNLLDCIGYYRAQEFKHWWPINVAELRELQQQVAAAVDGEPGRITTIAADARAVLTRAPGQVAVPVIDRWLDQAPEKLAGLATLLAGASSIPNGTEIKTAWSEFLASQASAAETSNYNPEGVPVAVDGLQMLARLIEEFSTDQADANELRVTLRSLAAQNERYEKSARNRAAYDTWAPMASYYLGKLADLTRPMMSKSEEQGTESSSALAAREQ